MGRPKTYKRDDVLALAVELFWLQGFEGTSTAALAKAMGLNKNTMYTEFDSKQALFEAALEHYIDHIAPVFLQEILQPDAGLPAIHAVFDRFGGVAGQPGTERGCMACNAATELASADLATRALVKRYVDLLIGGFQTCLDNAVADGSLRGDTDTAVESHRLTTTLLGMFVLIRAQLDGTPARDAARATLRSLSAGPPAKRAATP